MDITRRFSFVSKGLPADTFSVVSFTGTEGLSRPYEFIIDLVSTKADLEMEDVIHDLSELRILRAKSDIRFQGVLARLEQLNAVNNYVFYRTVLVPRFWALKLTRHNRIFLDKSTPEILKEVLTESGLLSTVDVELRLMRDHPSREYVCQYRESNFDFISRWMEREGMYYFFEQGDRGEKLVITDTKESHTPMPGAPDLRYSQDKGLELASSEELAVTFICEQNMVPRTVMVKDYNYRKPTLELKAESNIAENGLGTVYVYGDNFKTSKEAKTQATVRAEEARTSQQLFKGTGTAPFLRPGFVFKLFNHFRNAFNSQYLTTEVEHHGDQSGYLLAGLGRVISSREAKNFYSNAFTAVPVETQFRPKRTTPLPRFYGIMNAVIDAEGSGDYAELDEQGRYKVRLPFDIADRPDGKASSWLHMAQPYGGGGHGMHFPLHKGTEVLLSFVDGDPDRPIIASAVPNFEQAQPGERPERSGQCHQERRGQPTGHGRQRGAGIHGHVVAVPQQRHIRGLGGRRGRGQHQPVNRREIRSIHGWKLQLHYSGRKQLHHHGHQQLHIRRSQELLFRSPGNGLQPCRQNVIHQRPVRVPG